MAAPKFVEVDAVQTGEAVGVTVVVVYATAPEVFTYPVVPPPPRASACLPAPMKVLAM